MENSIDRNFLIQELQENGSLDKWRSKIRAEFTNSEKFESISKDINKFIDEKAESNGFFTDNGTTMTKVRRVLIEGLKTSSIVGDMKKYLGKIVESDKTIRDDVRECLFNIKNEKYDRKTVLRKNQEVRKKYDYQIESERSKIDLIEKLRKDEERKQREMEEKRRKHREEERKRAEKKRLEMERRKKEEEQEKIEKKRREEEKRILEERKRERDRQIKLEHEKEKERKENRKKRKLKKEKEEKKKKKKKKIEKKKKKKTTKKKKKTTKKKPKKKRKRKNETNFSSSGEDEEQNTEIDEKEEIDYEEQENNEEDEEDEEETLNEAPSSEEEFSPDDDYTEFEKILTTKSTEEILTHLFGDFSDEEDDDDEITMVDLFNLKLTNEGEIIIFKPSLAGRKDFRAFINSNGMIGYKGENFSNPYDFIMSVKPGTKITPEKAWDTTLLQRGIDLMTLDMIRESYKYKKRDEEINRRRRRIKRFKKKQRKYAKQPQKKKRKLK